MKNITIFNDKIPLKDRIVIPIDGDDDSYFIEWSVKNNAILVTNDLLREHHGRIKGEKLEKFNNWISTGRCGYIFVDEEFIPDPNFNIKVIHSEVEEDDKSRPRTKRPIKISDEEIFIMNKMSFAEINSELDYLETKILQFKNSRNDLNAITKDFALKRNELNTKVKMQITEVKKLKLERDESNLKVKKLKMERKKIDNELKKSKLLDIGDKKKPEHKIERKKWRKEIESTKTKRLIEKQIKAHEMVEEMVKNAQLTHEKMIEISDLVEEQRGEATTEHNMMMKSLKEANIYHDKYLLSLAKKFKLIDILNDLKGKDFDKNNQNQVMNKKEKKLLKKTQSKHPFISEVFQLNSDEEVCENLNKLLKNILIEYKSKTGRREHIVDRGMFNYKINNQVLEISSVKGYVLSIINDNRSIIVEGIISEYKLGSFTLETKHRVVC